MTPEPSLHVLLVCPYFAPENTIAAVRMSKFAEHWSELGHRVTVLTRQRTSLDGPQVDDRVHVVRVHDPTARAHQAAVGGRYDDGGLDSTRSWPRRFLAAASRRLSPWPDRFVLWALRARRVDVPRPDVVFASGGPLSSLLLGASLARRFDVPWVADYRDLLSTGDYLRRSAFRRSVEKVMERRAGRTAAALTAVSEPMSDALTDWLGRPAVTVLNGFDRADFPEPASRVDDDRLQLLYCGEIYHGKRDPGPVFAALGLLAPEERSRVVVDFYGASVEHVADLAERHGVADLVRTHERVSYREALGLQRGADALLSLLWNDPREGGVYSGKLFEYVGAGRPIIAVGWEDGVAAALVRDRRLGIASNDPETIRDCLSGWIREKQPGKPLPWASQPEVEDLTREAQSRRALEVIVRASGSEAFPST